MRTWFDLLGRRALAFALDLALLGAFSALVLWWDDRYGFLFAYNAEQLGDLVVFAWFLIPELCWNTTVGKRLLRLELQASDGLTPRRTQVGLRSLLFWIAVNSPGTFAPHWDTLSWLLNDRQRIIASLALFFSIMLLPVASCFFSATGLGVHDFLTNVRVLRSSTQPAKSSSLPAFNIQWSPRLYAIGCILFIALASLSMVIDWSFNVGVGLTSTIRTNRHYFEAATAEAEKNSATFGSMIPPLTAQWTEAYVAPSPHVVLLGSTQHYVLPVSRRLVADHEKAIEYARLFATDLLRLGAPSGVKWIALDLTNSRQFGLFTRTLTLPCLVNMDLNIIEFPPREVADTIAHAKSEIPSTLLAWVDDKITTIKVVWNRPHLDRYFSINTTSWDPLSVDFLARRDLRFPTPLGTVR